MDIYVSTPKPDDGNCRVIEEGRRSASGPLRLGKRPSYPDCRLLVVRASWFSPHDRWKWRPSAGTVITMLWNG